MERQMKEAKLLSCITPTAGAAGATNINGSIIDCAGFHSCLFQVHFGAIVSGAVVSIKAQSGDQSDLSDAADVAGTSLAVGDTDDDKVFFIDLQTVGKRYVRLVVSRATQNATVCAIALLNNPRQRPTVQAAGVSGVAVFA